MGVMVGALAAGAVGDLIGRRKLMLVNIAWFSVGMALTATRISPAFGLFRFFTGIGVGALVATAGAMVAEFAPQAQRNLYNAIVYSGVPAGGVLAALLRSCSATLAGAACSDRRPAARDPVPAGVFFTAGVTEVAPGPRPHEEAEASRRAEAIPVPAPEPGARGEGRLRCPGQPSLRLPDRLLG